MSTIWAPVIAALGASLLTGVFTLGVEWWRAWKTGKATLIDRRSRAYSALLARSISVMQLSTSIHISMEQRSGLREGVNVATGKLKPVDPLEFARWLNAEMQPLYDAWSEVWVVGSKEAVAAANDLLNKCGDVMGAATQRGQARAGWLQRFAGEKWTQEQLNQWQAEVRAAAEARRRFGEIVRKETGVEVADLFASNEPKQPMQTVIPTTGK